MLRSRGSTRLTTAIGLADETVSDRRRGAAHDIELPARMEAQAAVELPVSTRPSQSQSVKLVLSLTTGSLRGSVLVSFSYA